METCEYKYNRLDRYTRVSAIGKVGGTNRRLEIVDKEMTRMRSGLVFLVLVVVFCCASAAHVDLQKSAREEAGCTENDFLKCGFFQTCDLDEISIEDCCKYMGEWFGCMLNFVKSCGVPDVVEIYKDIINLARDSCAQVGVKW
uniref:Uncharacterized protein n=1 Tax=Rhodosorus marinus TaxID=101924 RepID=A0A7S0G9Q5_9RHOD